MSERSPFFYAWCDEASRVDAFAAALSALARPGGLCSVMTFDVMRSGLSIDGAIAMVRTDFVPEMTAYVSFDVTLSSGRLLAAFAHCCGEECERRRPLGPLWMAPSEGGQLPVARLPIGPGSGARHVEVEAAIAAIAAQQEAEDLLVRFCKSQRVTTGGCTGLRGWGAPVELGATYHADAASVGRDLALSWVHLHDKAKVERAASLSLDALRARVEAAPPEARVAVQGGAELSRAQVLAALATPPGALLDALEACAVPDDEWRAVEPLALETLQATHEGAPTYDVDVTTRQHVRFLQQHAPYHVRRLPNGGVLLATHPYRVLWPLWADALFLLGITKNDRGAG